MSHGPPAKSSRTNAADEDEDENQLPVPPDGGWGWVVAFASFAIHIVTDGITYSFGNFNLEFLKYFSAGTAYTALIPSILVGVTLCSGPISSAFVNRFGCRSVTIAGAILSALALFASAFAPNVLVLMGTIGLGVGFGFGLIYLPAIVSVTMYFEKYRSLATGIAVCGSGFGTVVFSPLTNYLIQSYGWRGAMMILSAIVLNCIIFGVMFRPLEPPPKKPKELHEIEAAATNKHLYLDVPKANGGHISNNNTDNRSRSNSTHEGHLKPKALESIKYQNGDNVMKAAVSQPLLSEEPQRTIRESGRATSGTMYRPDILYQGSLSNISQCRSRGELGSNEGMHYGSTNAVRSDDADSDQVCYCCSCSKESRDSFSEMLNFSMLLDPIFIIFVVSNFCTSIGFYIPYVHLGAHAAKLGLTETEGSYLISVIGFANTVGRIILGFFADKPYVNRLWVYNWSLTLCGVATAFSVICLDFYSLALYATVFGFTIGAYVGLTSVILVDLLGLEKLTNAFGLLLLFQGIASFMGPPLAGILYDQLQSYTYGFLLAGITIAASGIMLFAIPRMQRYLLEKENRKCNNETEMIPC